MHTVRRWSYRLFFLLTACGGTRGTANDLDGDGIDDSFDQCMADPEDLDGFEDDDGCPEPGNGDGGRKAVTDDDPALEGPSDPAPPRSAVRRLPPLRLKAQSPPKIDIQPYAKDMMRAVSSKSASVVIGSRFSLLKGTKNTRLETTLGTVRFSADGSTFAATTPKGYLVVDVHTGKTLRKVADRKGAGDFNEKTIEFRGGGLRYFDGCQLFVADDATSAPSSAGTRMCGRPFPAGESFLVWASDPESDSVNVFDIVSGKEPTIAIGGTGTQGGLSELAVSPDGSWICFSRQRDGSGLVCRNPNRDVELTISDGPTDRRATFDNRGRLYAALGERGKQRELVSVDLDKATLQPLHTLSSGERFLETMDQIVYASGGNRVVVIDPNARTLIDLSLGASEWEDLHMVPGDNLSFIAGKERRGGRDLFLIRVK